MSTKHSVESHLGLSLETYDAAIRTLVPHYDEMIETGLKWVKRLAKPSPNILDLGSGTGRLSQAILREIPDATVEVLDIDSKALEVARRRLEGFSDRVHFREGSFFDPLPKVDVVMASLSLHHIHVLEKKHEVYRSIHSCLNTQGVFLCLDATISKNPKIASLELEEWAKKMGDHGISHTAAHQHFKDWEEEDRYFSLEEELVALKESGFKDPEVFWRRVPVAIYGACH